MSFIVICMYSKPTFKAHSKEIILLGDLNINWDSKKDRKNLKTITISFNFYSINWPTNEANKSI